MASNNAYFGSLGISLGVIHIPCLPTIVVEWAALIPLVVHLASYQDDYITAGNISLLGRLPTSLFPALGTFSNLVRFLEQGSRYLDYASMKGGFGQKAWDVNWGSTFPVANGAASASIISFLTKKRRPTITKTHVLANPGASSSTLSRSTQVVEKADENKYRPQILNVYNFDRVNGQEQTRRPLRHILHRLRAPRLFQALQIVGLVALFAFFIVSEAFGTAAVVLIRVISEVFIQLITIPRPVGYLKNSETHNACMVVAAHENAMEWHLYTGDRGIVDTLLNKPMIIPPEGRRVRVAAMWFWCAHISQLMAMTLVAAQKGWDGVCLIILLAAHYLLSWLCGCNALVRGWMEREQVEVKVGSFEFSGRYTVIGAIQILSGTKIDRWMDSILIPHPRRNIWLDSLKLPEGQFAECPRELSGFDEKRMRQDVRMAREAAKLIKQTMPNLMAVV